MIDRIEEIKNYRQKVSKASVEATKREAFKDLLNRLFAHNPETKNIVDVPIARRYNPDRSMIYSIQR